MTQPIAWSERNTALLETLTRRVRFLSLEQIARTWWTGDAKGGSAAERHLRRLCAAGYLERHTVLVHPELPLCEPVLRWQPDEPAPDFEQISYRCKSRWKLRPTIVSVWIASTGAAKELGGFGGEIIRMAHASHDLHIGALYCRLLLEEPEKAAQWVPEARLKVRANEKLPDALFLNTEGKPYFVLDFGGSCKPERVQKLHAFGRRYHLSYELW